MKPIVNAGRLATSAKPACPVCRCDQVSTTSRTVTETTYWRCHACGEIWNQARLLTFKVRR
jgi:transposase-like protein